MARWGEPEKARVMRALILPSLVVRVIASYGRSKLHLGKRSYLIRTTRVIRVGMLSVLAPQAWQERIIGGFLAAPRQTPPLSWVQ